MIKLGHSIIVYSAMLFSTGATAGSIVEFEIQDAGQTQVQSAHIHEGFVSVKNPGDTANVDALYQREFDRLIVIEHNKRSYMLIDEAKVDQFAAQARGMRTVIQGQLEGMPEDQRAEMEKMMENMGLSGMVQDQQAEPEPEYVQTSEQREVNGYSCQVFRVLKNQQLDSEMCVASRKSLSMSENDYDTLKAMHHFAQRMASKAAMFLGNLGGTFPGLAAGKIDGLPVMVHDIDDDIIVTLRSISEAEIDPSRLGVPKGYTESALPVLGQ